MPFETFTLALLLSGLVYLSLAGFVYWYFRSSPGAKSFIALMLAVSVYSVGYYFELHSPTLTQVYFWLKIEYLGIAPFPALFFLFVLQYTKRDRCLNIKTIAALLFIPIVTYMLIFTNDSYHLFYRSLSLVAADGLNFLQIVRGPWYWVNIMYVNLLILAGNIILLQMWLQTPAPHNRQYASMFLASGAPWIGYFVYLAGRSPLNLDLSPFGMVIAGLIYVFSLIKLGVFDIIPVASTVVLEKMRDGVVVIDNRERIVDLNAAAVQFFGAKGDLIGQSLDTIFKPAAGEVVRVAENSDRTELQEETATGSRWLDLMFSPLANNQGEVQGYAVIIRDITKLKLAQAETELTNRELAIRNQELAAHSQDLKKINDMMVKLQACSKLTETYPIIAESMQGILPTLAGGLYIYSPRGQSMQLVCSWNNIAFLADEFKPDDCWGLVKGEVHRVTEFATESSCRHVERGYGHNYTCHPLYVAGEPFALLHYYYLVLDLSENQVQMAQVAADAVRLALMNIKMKDNLLQESIHDSLTGLFNRRFMSESLRLELPRVDRMKRALSVIMVDVDYYKEINDQYGHVQGDRVLVEVSKVLRKCIRRSDIACRYGGDEFVLILPGAATAVAVQRAAAIHEEIEKTQLILGAGSKTAISISIGVATYPVHGASPEALLRAADKALYQAKESGRSCTMVAAD